MAASIRARCCTSVSSGGGAGADAIRSARAWNSSLAMRADATAAGPTGVRVSPSGPCCRASSRTARRSDHRGRPTRRGRPARPGRPTSKTSTRSAASAVDSRWATLKVVRPSASRCRAVVNDRSVRGSTALVASSSTRSPGSPRWARASATSWRSPTERFSPRSPTSVRKPSGRPSTHEDSPRSATAAATSASVAPDRPMRMFSMSEVSKTKPSCGTRRIRRWREDGATSRRSTPPDHDPACRGVGQTDQEAGEGGLPGPGLAHHGHRGPRRHRHRHVAQHRRPRAVPEADRLDRHVERAWGEVVPGIGFDDVDGLVEQIEDAAPTCDRGLRLVEDLPQLSHRTQDELHQEQAGQQPTGVQAPPRPPPHTHPDDGREGDGAERVPQGEHEGEPTRRAHLGAVLAVGGAVEAGQRPSAQAVGPHGGGSLDRLGHLAHGLARRDLAPLRRPPAGGAACTGRWAAEESR